MNFYNTSPFGEDNISALTHNRYDGTIWPATATSVEGVGGGTVSKGTGLKYTTDNGENWTSITQPVDNDNDTVEVYSNNILPALPVTVGEQNLTYDMHLLRAQSGLHLLLEELDEVQIWVKPGKEL